MFNLDCVLTSGQFNHFQTLQSHREKRSDALSKKTGKHEDKLV